MSESRSITDQIADVLAAHPPTYSEYANDPTTTFDCRPCSEAIGDWVIWTPAHVAAALVPVVEAAQADAWDEGKWACYSAERESRDGFALINPYRAAVSEAGEDDDNE